MTRGSGSSPQRPSRIRSSLNPRAARLVDEILQPLVERLRGVDRRTPAASCERATGARTTSQQDARRHNGGQVATTSTLCVIVNSDRASLPSTAPTLLSVRKSPVRQRVTPMPYTLNVNGQDRRPSTSPPTCPCCGCIRDVLNLKGTKFGCGIGQCGACTVHLRGRAVRSCQTPVSAAANAPITTIEGLSADGTHPLQVAWQEIDVPQCGYCQAGQIMSAAALLAHDAEADRRRHRSRDERQHLPLRHVSRGFAKRFTRRPRSSPPVPTDRAAPARNRRTP